MATAKLKTIATQAPQTREDCAADIRKVGDLSREIARLEADMNDEIAAIQERGAKAAAPFKEQISVLQTGIQAYCESNREDLTNNGKVKFADFVTGVVKWRMKPPSCSVRKADVVIDTLKRLGLSQFIRTKEEVNKEAVLENPDDIRGVAGLSVVTGVEEFVIEPAAQELATA